jgi:HEAT repeat protein
MMGRNDADAVIARARGRGRAPSSGDLVRQWRPDLLSALIDAAPPGSASTIVPALFDPLLAVRATRALERLPRDEAESALAFAGLGATPDEGGAFAQRDVAVTGALAAALRSRVHRTRCFWSAVTTENGMDFLLAAVGSPLLRDEALMFLGLLPEDAVSEACRKALEDPDLAAGAARAAGWLGDRRLVPALMRAAKSPPPGMGSAGIRIEEGELMSARSESFETVCLDAIAQLNRP